MPVTQPRTPADNGGGWPPDKEPAIAQALVEAWSAAYEDSGSDANTMREDLYLRASDAGACSRALGYRVRRRMSDPDMVELSNPPTVADQYRMNTGSLVHEEMGKHLMTAYPGATVEVLTIREDEPKISMHVDAVVKEGTKTTVVEVKTINGMGFKRCVGVAKQSDPPQGPRHNAIVQGALAAYEHDADELVVLVFALELIGKAIQERNHLSDLDLMVAQWTLSREQWEPLALREQARMSAVLKIVQDGKLPPRSIPDVELPLGNRITDPRSGSWVLEDQAGNIINLGNTWHCDYCWDRDNCIKDGPT